MKTVTKNRDGMVLRNRLPKKTAPSLKLIYSREKATKENGTVIVNGHKNRVLALEAKWNELFAIDNNLKQITIIDLAENYSYQKSYCKESYKCNGFSVEIADTQRLATNEESKHPDIKYPNIVINYYNDIFGKTENDMSGNNWFFFKDDRFSSGIGVDFLDTFVLIVPNGNKEKFYEQIDVRNIASILNEFGGGTMKVCEGLDTETFDKFAVSADIVITTPSTTAMELATLNKPMLLVKTSEDQTGDFSTIASDYSDDMLRLLLSRKDVREVYGRNDIKNNIDKVVNEIYATWEKWNNEQS